MPKIHKRGLKTPVIDLTKDRGVGTGVWGRDNQIYRLIIPQGMKIELTRAGTWVLMPKDAILVERKICLTK